MTRNTSLKSDKDCIWKGSMLDTVVPFSGSIDVSKAYPSHSVFITKEKAAAATGSS